MGAKSKDGLIIVSIVSLMLNGTLMTNRVWSDDVRLGINHGSTSDVIIDFNSDSNSYYLVHKSIDMTDLWSTAHVLLGGSGRLSWTNLGTALDVSSLGFYRIQPIHIDDSQDQDHDELSDIDELSLWATDPLDSDTDHDTVNDGNEVARGTDPSNPVSLNVTLYADSVVGSNAFDGLTPMIVSGHGPKRDISAVIDVGFSGDAIEINGGIYSSEQLWDPGSKIILLVPKGSVSVR